MTLERILVVAAIIFCIGLYGAITKRNAIAVLMCIELMFNAVNITAVALSRYTVPASLAANPASTAEDALQFLLTGQVFAIFIITVAAAEVALGLAIIIAVYRNRQTADISQVSMMKY